MSNETTVNKKHKDRLFSQIFGSEENKEYALDLYNALAGTSYTNVDDLEYNTLDDSIFLHMKNDVSFIFHSEINLWEHQSTINENMPLRGLLYVSQLYNSYIETNGLDIYQKNRATIPAPKYIVFYNGIEKYPDKSILKLSDSFAKPSDCLEMIAEVYNVNKGHNKELLQTCEMLSNYAEFIFRIRQNAKTMAIKDAIEAAIDSCIKDNIMASFLMKHRSEVSMSVLTEYNEELHLKNVHKEGFDEGFDKGSDNRAMRSYLNSIDKGLSREDAMEIAEITEEQAKYAEQHRDEILKDNK